MLLIYTRVSSTEQAADDRSSLEIQERIGRGYAMSNGFAQFDIAIYTDPGVSGSVSLGKRPAGQQLIDDSKPGDFVFASKLDRMFRSASDALYQVEAFRKRGVKVVLFDLGSEPIGDSAIGQFFFTCMAAVATLERATIKERCVNGKKAKVAKGGYGGGKVPFGFSVVGKGREARLVEDERQQRALAAVRNLIKERPRANLGEVRLRLSEEGHTARNGKPFFLMQVSRMVQKVRSEYP